jgi:2-haloacid dehalogenase
MRLDTSANPTGIYRRQFLRTAVAAGAITTLTLRSLSAQGVRPAIKAVAFDAFAIFDARSVLHLAEEIFPGRGAALSDQWRTRQFEYTWLRNSMREYQDFWRVTEDALSYAAKQTGVTLDPAHGKRLMAAYLELKPWPDVAAIIDELHRRGLRLALLTNWTATMQRACLQGAGLETTFEFQLSTDRVRAYKPDPAAYGMGPDAFGLEKREIAFVAFGGWDAAGAKAFGYPTYWTNRLNLPFEELGVLPDATFHDLSGLPRFIDSGHKTDHF